MKEKQIIDRKRCAHRKLSEIQNKIKTKTQKSRLQFLFLLCIRFFSENETQTSKFSLIRYVVKEIFLDKIFLKKRKVLQKICFYTLCTVGCLERKHKN